ncbi:MAG TPA: ABC transporter ATP-binding protein [Cytophagaceae bacterium]
MKHLLETKNINKYFHDPTTVHVLTDVSITIDKGEFVSIIGRSGSGKSTLLYILSTMDTDFEGELYLDGESMRNRSNEELARVRNEKIGFVFQFHYLLPEFTVLKNVMLPGLKLKRYSDKEVEEIAMNKLRELGIEKLAHRNAAMISGGEKQRVAIARALINDPLIIMCDEPTGNLDKRNSEIVFEIFQRLVYERGQSILVVTHDADFASRTDRIIEMEDGKIIGDRELKER